jgi:hypothetical protein
MEIDRAGQGDPFGCFLVAYGAVLNQEAGTGAGLLF